MSAMDAIHDYDYKQTDFYKHRNTDHEHCVGDSSQNLVQMDSEINLQPQPEVRSSRSRTPLRCLHSRRTLCHCPLLEPPSS
jgi:hypothetical protein